MLVRAADGAAAVQRGEEVELADGARRELRGEVPRDVPPGAHARDAAVRVPRIGQLRVDASRQSGKGKNTNLKRRRGVSKNKFRVDANLAGGWLMMRCVSRRLAAAADTAK